MKPRVVAIANDTEYGLGAGVWTRDVNKAYRVGRAIHTGRVWTNCYHLYPAHAAFGGYKKSGIGRETHKMMLEHYQQTKNLLVSYDVNPPGFSNRLSSSEYSGSSKEMKEKRLSLFLQIWLVALVCGLPALIV